MSDVNEVKISIIIPLFNRLSTIEETLDSCFFQDYPFMEVIVVDDGSTDGSGEIVQEKYKDVIYYKQENQGAPAARNKGIEISTGEYFLLLDAGDSLKPGIIKRVAKLAVDDVDMVMGNYTKKFQNGKEKLISGIKHDEILIGEDCLKSYCLAPSPICKIYRKEFVEKNDVRFSSLSIGQDLNFHIKYLIGCNKIHIIPDYFGTLAIIEGGISRNYTRKIADIVNSFMDIREYASQKTVLVNRYTKIQDLEYYHIFWQMVKVPLISEAFERNYVFDSLKNELIVLNQKCCGKINPHYQKYHLWLKVICKMRFIWTSKVFKVIYAPVYTLKTNRHL